MMKQDRPQTVLLPEFSSQCLDQHHQVIDRENVVEDEDNFVTDDEDLGEIGVTRDSSASEILKSNTMARGKFSSDDEDVAEVCDKFVGKFRETLIASASEIIKSNTMARDYSFTLVGPEDNFICDFERMELYSIQVLHVEKDRNFRRIYVDNPWRDQFIYERGKKEKLPTNKPLPLCGPYRPLISCNPILIRFGKTSWRWEFLKFTMIPYNPAKVHPEGVRTEIVKDRRRSPSSVEIRYEWINESVEANFQFAFDDKAGCSFQILKGVISATTNGRIETKRVLRYFTRTRKCNSPWKIKKKDNRRFISGEIIPLNRGIIAMPINGELHVSVDLTYCVYSPNNERITERRIRGTQSIKVPKTAGLSKWSFFDCDGLATLVSEVYWSDDVYPGLSFDAWRSSQSTSEPSDGDPTEAEDFEFFPDPTEAEDFELFPDPTEA